MTEEATPNDDAAAPDPVDAELIAYLDGELEPSAARDLEDRLDADAKLRARAESLKRSFDLLDFLPKPEPSASFATRTLDKLPVSGAKPAVATATATPAPATVPSGFSSLAITGVPPPRSEASWLFAVVGLFLSATFALAVGYLGTAALRTYVFPRNEPPEPSTDSLSVSEVRAIANLPLYAAVDDFEFLEQLAAPEFFGDELAPPDWLTPSQPLETEKKTDPELQVLFRAFRELPADRQEKIRLLDQRIHTQEPAKRDRSFRLLETYAAWLHKLTDADRADVLAAASPAKRLDAIREVLLKHWIAKLPVAHRTMLKALPSADKAKLLAKWRAEEEKSRTEWAVARVQWESIRTGKQPWPFSDERMKKDVLDYVRAVYRPDEPKRARLSTSGPDGGDAARLREALERADKGEWALLGKAVRDFDRKYEMLPEPGKGMVVVDYSDLPPALSRLLEKRPKVSRNLEQAAGKWPEFALAVHAELAARPLTNFPALRLGPASPDEFKDEMRRGVGELRKKLNDAEWGGLRSLDGVWPNYPRELVRLAKLHDVSLPGVMPPGPPSLWEKTYNPSRQPMRPGG
jgi:hypothetical protein